MNHPLLPWIQIPVQDLKRAADFYAGVFDVAFFFEELNGMPHAVFAKNHKGERPINGALVQLPEERQFGRGPVLFFEASGRFENALEAIVTLGGKVRTAKTIIKKREEGRTAIPNTYINDQPGYYAHFEDTEGNRMGLYGAH